MIDLVRQTLNTILNKENRGFVNVVEFNNIAHQVQMEIFKEYFEDENRDKNRANRGLSNRGLANLPQNQRSKMAPFYTYGTLTYDTGTKKYPLPSDVHMVEDRGVSTSANRVVEEVDRSALNHMLNMQGGPSTLFPVMILEGSDIKVYPETITEDLNLNYIRLPKKPKWTYTVVGGSELFNPSAGDYQDFELNQAEFTNIVLGMLVYFGINLREPDVVKIADMLKTKMDIKEDSNDSRSLL